jgi:hypothetical protein
MSDDLMLAGIIMVGVVLGLLVAVGLPVVLGTRNTARQRELEHAERLKALELGRPWPGGDAANCDWYKHKGVLIGVWVPLGALGIALAATADKGGSGNATVDMVTWIAAGTVGVAGVLCGTILAALRSPSAGVSTRPFHASTKPSFEEDAVDTVSRRG